MVVKREVNFPCHIIVFSWYLYKWIISNKDQYWIWWFQIYKCHMSCFDFFVVSYVHSTSSCDILLTETFYSHQHASLTNTVSPIYYIHQRHWCLTHHRHIFRLELYYWLCHYSSCNIWRAGVQPCDLYIYRRSLSLKAFGLALIRVGQISSVNI